MKDIVRSSLSVNRIALGCMASNIFLTIAKLIVGVYGKSTALIADGIHSLTDFTTDIILLISLKINKKPADENHNYGHGKFETLAAVMITMALFFAGYSILKCGVTKVIYYFEGGTISKPNRITLIVAIMSVMVKEGMYRISVYGGMKFQSKAMVANAWHHRSDALTSIAVAVGISAVLLFGNDYAIIDPLICIVVSIFVFKTGVDILIPCINELLDGSIEKEHLKQINELIASCDKIKAYHKLKTRHVGKVTVVEFHILVDEHMNIKEAHNVAHAIEIQIREYLGPHSHIIIHIEPFLEN